MDLSKQLKNISINDTHALKILSKNKSVISSFHNQKDYQTIYTQTQFNKKYIDKDINDSFKTIIYNDETIPIRESQIISLNNNNFKIKHIGSFSMKGVSSIKRLNKEEISKENLKLKENVKFLLNQLKKYQKNELNIDNSNINNDDNFNIETESIVFEIKKEFEDKINYYISEIKKYKKELKILKDQNNKLKAENKELEKLINVNNTDNLNISENINNNNNNQILNSNPTTYPITNYMQFYRNLTGKNLNNTNNNYCYNGYVNQTSSKNKKTKINKILHISSNNTNSISINNSNITQKRNFKSNTYNKKSNKNIGKEYIVVIDKPNHVDSNSYIKNMDIIPKTKNNSIKFIINTNKNDITKNDFTNIINTNTPLLLYKKIDHKNKIGKIEYIKPTSLKKTGYVCATPTLIRNRSQYKMMKDKVDELINNENNNYGYIKLENN